MFISEAMRLSDKWITLSESFKRDWIWGKEMREYRW